MVLKFVYRPPNGCLQYWTTLVGRFTTFNFLSTTGSNTMPSMRWEMYRMTLGRHGTQHNDTQHKWLICDTQHKWQSTVMTLGIRTLLNVAFYLFLCWMSLWRMSICRMSCRMSFCWMSLCWMTLCWMSLCKKFYNIFPWAPYIQHFILRMGPIS